MFSLEASLGQFARLLQQIASTFDGVFFLHDAVEKRLVYVSPNFSQLCGRSEECLYRDHAAFQDSVHPEDRPRVAGWFKKALGGSVSSSEFRILLPYGETRWLACCVGPILDQAGAVVRLAGLAMDITRRINAEHGLRQSQAQLRQVHKMQALGTLLAGVAHEINNPLNTLMFNVPLLSEVWRDLVPFLKEKAQDDPEARFGGMPAGLLADKLGQVLTDTESAVGRAAKIVGHLKDFARPAPVPQIEETSLNLAVEKALSLTAATLRKARVRVETSLDPQPPCLLADPTSLEEILINLIMNAAEAMDHHQGRIEVRTSQEGGRIRLEVADNGRGVPEDIADRLFEPFVTQRPDRSGTGLGLSVTRDLVQEFGGTISYQSQPGQGTVFTVLFPLNPRARLAQVLVVDDDQAMRRIMQKTLLAEPGIAVQVASGGMEALVKLGRYTPDLIVLDLFMPGMDGQELCRHLKSTPAFSQIGVLVVTGLPDSPEAQGIRESGMAEVLGKPIHVKVFMDKVQALLGRARGA